MTYALQTQELTTSQEQKLESFVQHCLRTITNNKWMDQKIQKPAETNPQLLSNHAIQLQTQQPTTTSWMNKQSTISMARQTRQETKIHLATQPRMQQLKTNWETEWENTSKYITKQEQNKDPEPKQNTQTIGLSKPQQHTTENQGKTQKIPYIGHIKNNYAKNSGKYSPRNKHHQISRN